MAEGFSQQEAEKFLTRIRPAKGALRGADLQEDEWKTQNG